MDRWHTGACTSLPSLPVSKPQTLEKTCHKLRSKRTTEWTPSGRIEFTDLWLVSTRCCVTFSHKSCVANLFVVFRFSLLLRCTRHDSLSLCEVISFALSSMVLCHQQWLPCFVFGRCSFCLFGFWFVLLCFLCSRFLFHCIVAVAAYWTVYWYFFITTFAAHHHKMEQF